MRNLLFAGCICLSNLICAQTEGEDIIVLKNGNEYLGKIIEQKPSQHIRLLQLPSKDTLTIQLVEIDRILKRESVNETQIVVNIPAVETSSTTQNSSTELVFNQSNYHFHINGMVSGGDYATVGMGVGLYRKVNSSLQLGAVFNYYGGVRNFDMSRGPGGSIPFGLDADYTLQEMWGKRMGLQIGCQLGYNFVTQGGHQRNDQNAYFDNGLFIHPAIGFRFNILKEVGMLLELGYRNVQSKSYYLENNEFIQKHSFSNIVLGGSIFF